MHAFGAGRADGFEVGGVGLAAVVVEIGLARCVTLVVVSGPRVWEGGESTYFTAPKRHAGGGAAAVTANEEAMSARTNDLAGNISAVV